MLSLLRAQDRRPAPWKNGQGQTTEIAIDPPGADLGRFDWRVSMAEVAASGPFSSFPGVDRWLMVLEGAMSLAVEGRAPADLSPDTPPLAFPGDAVTAATLIHGPVRDLNIMTARGRITVQAEPLRLRAGETCSYIAGQTALILCLSGQLHVTEAGGARQALGQADAVLVTQALEASLTLAAKTAAYLVTANFTRLRATG